MSDIPQPQQPSEMTGQPNDAQSLDDAMRHSEEVAHNMFSDYEHDDEAAPQQEDENTFTPVHAARLLTTGDYIQQQKAKWETHKETTANTEELEATLSVSRIHAKKMERAANYDEDTGLLSKSAFLKRAKEKMQEHRRSTDAGRPKQILFLDLDRFKAINDSRGHGFGDDYIKEFATILLDEFSTDLVSRYGGEEFVALVEGTLEEAMEKARNVRLMTSQLSFVLDYDGPTTVSIGIATVSNETLKRTIADADAAMYVSKKEGRNRTTVYEPGMEHSDKNGDKSEHRRRESDKE